MSKKQPLSAEDQALFRGLMTGTRKLAQDTIVHKPQKKNLAVVPQKKLISEQMDASHYFSDEFQPLLAGEGPTRYVRSDVSHYELKKLRRGDYTPEIFWICMGLRNGRPRKSWGR